MAQMSHAPREHAWLKSFAPRAMSHMLPQNTSTQSLSCASTIFRPSSPSLTCPASALSELDPQTLRDPRQRGGYISESATGYEPKMIQSDDFEARRIELERNLDSDLQPQGIELDRNLGTEELSLTGILGQIRIKYQKEFWEMTFQILSQTIRRKLENLVSTCPTSNQGYTISRATSV